jgi:hypothetical protein
MSQLVEPMMAEENKNADSLMGVMEMKRSW